MPHLIYILFLFALGSCVGSFLNVVVWRLPNVKPVEEGGFTLIRQFYRSLHALSEPPSHCPKCSKLLKWYDNIPVFGWIKLGGRCRFCKEGISIRYPIVEATTGLMFVGYYWAYFIAQVGPCHLPYRPMTLVSFWWLYGLDMFLLSGLLAASLIDAELFIIPLGIPWTIAPIAVFVHAWFDYPGGTGSVCVSSPLPAALAAGAAVGVVISLSLLTFGLLPASFVEGAPMTEMERAEYERQKAQEQRARDKANGRNKTRAKADARPAKETPITPPEDQAKEYTPSEVRREISKEMLFLLPPLALAMASLLLAWQFEPAGRWWERALEHRWVAGMLGSVLGGLVGGFVVWLTRILGSVGFGREAMGMGDVDLMVAVGAVTGAGPAAAAFFIAPFFGILVAVYMLITRKTRELPYGPYLSLATAFVLLFYCPIRDYFGPGLTNLGWMMSRMFGAGGA